MNREFFEAEMDRLKSQWTENYGSARRDVLWDVFHDVSEAMFHEAVTILLLDGGEYAPGGTDITHALAEARGTLRKKTRQQLRLLSPQEKAAGEKGDE